MEENKQNTENQTNQPQTGENQNAAASAAKQELNQDTKYTQRTIYDALKEIEGSEKDNAAFDSEKDIKSSEEKRSDKEAEQKQKPDTQKDIKKSEQEKPASDQKHDKSEDLSKIDNRGDAERVLKSKGFDYTALYQEYLATGAISEKSRAELLKEGITPELIDSYIEGQKARVEASKNVYAEYVGGRKNLDSIVKWAEQNLSQSEINSINAITDINIVKIILKELKTRMEEKEGTMPEYTKGESGKVTQDIFHSQTEMFEAICNPKYRKDKAYRENVQKKISASIKAGVDLGI